MTRRRSALFPASITESMPRGFEVALHYASTVGPRFSAVLAHDIVLGHRVQDDLYAKLPPLGTEAVESVGEGNFERLAVRAWLGRVACAHSGRDRAEPAAHLDVVIGSRRWLMAARMTWRDPSFDESVCTRAQEQVIVALDPDDGPFTLHRIRVDDAAGAAVWKGLRAALFHQIVVRPVFAAGAMLRPTAFPPPEEGAAPDSKE